MYHPNILDVLESGPCKAAHVEPETQEVRIEKGCHERVAEQDGSKENASKDGDFGVSDEAHCWIVVGLDPGLDEFGDLSRGAEGEAAGAPPAAAWLAPGAGDAEGNAMGMTVVRKKVRTWKSENVTKGTRVMKMGLDMNQYTARKRYWTFSSISAR